MKNYLKFELNNYEQPIGIAVENHVQTHALLQPLVGAYVELIPFNAVSDLDQTLEHAWSLIQNEPDASCWTYLPYHGFSSFDELRHNIENEFGFGDFVHYFIQVNQQTLGWIALLNPRLNHAAIEIGNVYFSYQLRKTPAATDAVYLLLSHCFKNGFRRLEWKCDDLNEPSKRAALRFGFSFEGIFRQDRISKGHNRNTTWFSILDEEWTDLEPAYKTWLAPENFDAFGQQQQRLNDLITQYRPL